jgi:hypothetical protein
VIGHGSPSKEKENMAFFNAENLILGTLSQDSFVMVNKKLSRKLGFIEAGILGEMLFIYRSCKESNSFYDNGKQGNWFYITQPYIEKNLGIKRRMFDTAIKNLLKFGIFEQKKLGLPAKNHYLINWDRIVEVFEEAETLDNDENTENEYENSSQPLIQSVCTKRTSKEVQNVQARVHESYKHVSTKQPPIIKNYKKDIKKELNKKELLKSLSSEDEKLIVDVLTEFNFERKLINQIIFQFDNQDIEVNKHQLIKQAKFMRNYQQQGNSINDKAKASYFVNGYEDKLTKAKRPATATKAKAIENEQGFATQIPFYNWLEQ